MKNQFIIKDSIEAFGLTFELCDVVNDNTRYDQDNFPIMNYRQALIVSKQQQGWTIFLDGESWADIDAARLAGFLMKSRQDKNKKYDIKLKKKIQAIAVQPEPGDVKPIQKQVIPTTFYFKEADVKEVILLGSFNDWELEKGVPLIRGDDGIWRARVELEMGRYEYKFLVDGEWRLDPDSPDKIHGENGANSIIRVWQDPVREELDWKTDNEMLSRFMRVD